MSPEFLCKLVAPIIAALTIAAPCYAAESSHAAAIRKMLDDQCNAWNVGDLDSFMTSYLKSPDTSYTSGGTEVWGYDALRERYAKKYGTDKSSMGKLSFSDLRIFDLGAKNALAIGHWHLERAKQPSLNGVYSLVLQDTKDGWRILHDHTSLKPDEPAKP